MNPLEGISIAVAELLGNKLRSALSVLGVVIGVAAVVALVSIGQGASQSVSAQIQRLGSNLITVVPMRGAGASFTVEDAEMLVRRVPSIKAAVPYVSLETTAKCGNQKYETTAEGVTPEYLDVRGFSVQYGRFISTEEVTGRRRVAVIGQTVLRELMQGGRALGQTVLIEGQDFTVIGVLASKGATMGRDLDDVILIPVSTALRLARTDKVTGIYAQASSPDLAQVAVQHLSAVLERKFRRPDSFRVFSQEEILETMGTVSRTMTLMLGAIAGIALLVGGIGVMNIMLVAVAERTREIGIRKALGATRLDILVQFLAESTAISCIGGVVGILAGVAVSQTVSRVAGWAAVISPWALIVAFGFAATVGLFFGVYPAMRAASLSPVDALRYE